MDYAHKVSVLDVFVTYQDTDLAGVVYFANYFNYSEKGRSKLLRDLFGKTKLDNQNWAIRKTECKYLLPAKLDDKIEIYTYCKEIKQTYVIFQHDFHVDNVKIAEIYAQLVSIDNDLKLTKIDKTLMELMSPYRV